MNVKVCKRGRPVSKRAVRSARRRRAEGFTLLELLVASALLALLAIIGWRGLDSILTARDRIVMRSDDLRALAVAMAQMDEDLRRSWPVRNVLPVQNPRIIDFDIGTTGVALHLMREGGGALDPVRVERIAYRVRGDLLERGFGPLLAPPSAANAAGVSGAALLLSDAPLVWQPLLADVAAVQYRAFVPQRGWADPTTLAMARAQVQAQVPGVAPVSPSTPPVAVPGTGVPGTGTIPLEVTGVEVIIQRRNGDQYRRVFAVRD